MEWIIRKIRLELKYSWKISRNESAYKENFIIEAEENGLKGMGEVAPNIRYNETPESILEAFDLFCKCGVKAIKNINDLTSVLQGLKIPNALRFGLESACIHLLCAKENKTIYQFLNIEKPGKVPTCYTLPIMDVSEIKPFFTKYNLARFPFIKIKINNVYAIEHLNELLSICKVPLMIDANEAWNDVDELINFLPQLKKFPVVFIEQPMPAVMKEEYVYLKKNCPLPLMADESILDQPDFDLLEQQFDGINMKLMKAGGYINGVNILNEARSRKMTTMVGCMVETTLGISSAWNLCANTNFADLDGCLIVANEPFNLLKEEHGNFFKTGSQANRL